MKFLFAAATTFAALAPASAQTGDPKLDFLGYCVEQGNPTTYCACLTDAHAAKMNAKELTVYLDYLRVLASGERDQEKIIAALKERNGITGKELGRILQLATTVAQEAATACGGT